MVEKVNSIQGYIRQPQQVVGGDLSLLWRPSKTALESCVQFLPSQYKTDINTLGCVQQRATNAIKGLENLV